MEMPGRLELANENAAAFWLAQAEAHGWEHRRRPGFVAVRCERASGDAHRVVVTRPYEDPAPVRAELVELFRSWNTTQLCLEDPYGGIDLTPYGCEATDGKPVMTREPDAVTADERPPTEGLTVTEAVDADALAAVERVVVDGFPIPARQPWARGEMLPAGLLRLSGYRAWLARLDGHPVGACMSYDNGETVGLYWVATLLECRGKGVAGAVVAAALAAHPGRVATLVATDLGRPVYRRLGFTEQGTTVWWRYPAVTAMLARAFASQASGTARKASSGVSGD